MNCRAMIAALMLVAASAATAAQDIERDRLSGEFAVTGTTRDGRTYRGNMTIARRGDVYQVRWQLDTGERYDGVAIAQGAILSVGWTAGEAAGVAVYDFSRTPIAGKWSTVGDDKIYSEELLPRR